MAEIALLGVVVVVDGLDVDGDAEIEVVVADCKLLLVVLLVS